MEDKVVSNEKDVLGWKQRDCRARCYIISTIEQMQQLLLIDCVTARDVGYTFGAES